MKNFITRLKRRKGFTLIECLIALAVFAALTLVVFAILTNARAASIKANETEENLTKLIDNVVEDESYVKYNGDPDDILTLKLSTGGTDFRVSYTAIDGYKNHVLCPAAGCQYFAENTEFMGAKDQEGFDQSAYICPKCGATIIQTLICEDCGSEGEHASVVAGSTTAGRFTYIPGNGGYFCNDCGGTSVRGKDINETTISNYDLNVKTLVPNAIVFGNVTRKDDLYTNFIQMADSSGGTVSESVNMGLSYTPGANATIPGVYTLDVTSQLDDVNFEIDVRLPEGYRVIQTYATLGDCLGLVDADGPYLHFTGCDKGAKSQVKFCLVNEKSGLSFEEDYGNDTNPELDGLAGYWFRFSTGATTKTFTP